ncbi:MAG: peptidylprolyl isomerase [Nitrospirota bacterium]
MINGIVKNLPFYCLIGITSLMINTFVIERDANADEKKSRLPVVTIKTDKGDIIFEMYPDIAPKTVARIIELIKQDFYNGLIFHRVIPGFVIQGGDPKGNGTGGTGKKLPAEFSKKKHLLGTVAMARRSDDINSSDSQFYICLAPQPHLDGKYTVFGQVIKGLDVIKEIAKGDVMRKVTVKE